MLQEIIVFLIVGAAAAYMIRTLYRKFKGQESCGCGCGGCAEAPTCPDKSGDESLRSR